MKYLRPAWVEIDLKAIENNIQKIRKNIGKKPLMMAVVKADAYGHGAVEVSKQAASSGVNRLGVALLEELIALRKASIDLPVHILSDSVLSAVPGLVHYDAIPSVNSYDIAEALSKEAISKKKTVKVHVKVDTGMTRSGIMPKDAVDFVKQIIKLDGLWVEGVFTHLATADQPNLNYTVLQMNKFDQVLKGLEAARIKPPIVHVANSASALLLPKRNLDMVRVGIMLYGLYPCEATRGKVDIKPALSLKAKVSRVEEIGRGTGVSYGITYIASDKVSIATLPLGYADGYTRLLSNRANCLINGQKCRIVGNITMDQMMVEIPKGLSVKRGDTAVLIGSQEGQSITVDELAGLLGTINYEITCMLSKRLPRVFKN